MSIRERPVKNKKKANGLPSGKEGIVFDVYLKQRTMEGFRSYCRRGFLSRKAAVDHENETRLEFQNKLRGKGSHQRLDEYLEQWLTNSLVSKHWSLNTLSGYQINIRKHILPTLGHFMLKEINSEKCDQLLRHLKFKGLSDTSIQYVRRTFSSALSDACAYDYILRNPIDHTITRLKQSEFSPMLYDLKMMAGLMNSVFDTVWECMFLLTGLYGLRRSEALGLKWKQIDFLKREIIIEEQLASRLVRSKTGLILTGLKTRNSARKLYLSDYAMDILLRQMERRKRLIDAATDRCPFIDQDFVLFRNDGRPNDETHLARQFHQLTDRLGFPVCRIHDLRHSTASNIYFLTGDYLVVAKILGHTVKGLTKTLGESKFYESTTSLYIHINPEKERIAIESYHETVGGMQVLQSQLQAAGSALGRAKIIRFC